MRGKISCYGNAQVQRLEDWQRSMSLAESIYKLAGDFPTEEKYGLSSQIKRSAVSIACIISEGAGRASNKQFKQFLEYAMGSCNEVQTQLELAKRFKFISDETSTVVLDEAYQVYKMILGFYNSLAEDH